MTHKRLTLKDLTHIQHKELNAAITAACKANGVRYVFELSDKVRQEITRETMRRFEEQNAAAQLAQEDGRAPIKSVEPAEVKTFTWGASRRR